MHGFKYWNGKCYRFIEAEENREGANNQCKNVSDGKATLVSIHGPEENEYVLSLFNDKEGVFASWIGASIPYPRTGKGTWIDGTPWDYSNWYPGEPNDISVSLAVSMRPDGNTPGKWKASDPRYKGFWISGLVCSYQPGK